MFELFFILSFVMMFGSIWLLICNQKTLEQRQELLPNPGDPEFWVKMEVFERVSYHQHLWELLMFRDPYRLYD